MFILSCCFLCFNRLTLQELRWCLLLKTDDQMHCDCADWLNREKTQNNSNKVHFFTNAPNQENRSHWKLNRQNGGSMFSLSTRTRVSTTEARMGDAAYLDISMESVLIWWSSSWIPANTNLCSQRTPALTQTKPLDGWSSVKEKDKPVWQRLSSD